MIRRRDLETLMVELGDRVMLRLQWRPRMVGNEFDLRWFRGLFR